MLWKLKKNYGGFPGNIFTYTLERVCVCVCGVRVFYFAEWILILFSDI